ncbi:hypothetical protein [Streptomyces hoynatensis]|uniref:hypothetical protein n=1 Tax=Streptomyces hoynatensis TaxID=1141874 RepID=UPI001F4E6B82|nr:hypothetical protein [Streptomyces hoynatensis]
MAAGTAVVVAGAAVTLAVLNWVVGLAADRQEISVGGVSPEALSVGAYCGGGVLGAFLLLCGILLVRIAVLDRAPGRAARAALVAAAVLHALLGALAVGLVGWPAFLLLMLVFSLLMLTLTLYPPPPDGAAAG